jgi:uncharacterized RDD family membrane protein YckC
VAESPEDNIATSRINGIGIAMVTGFDYLGHDRALQEHWLRRFAAILIDSVLIYVPVLFISSIVSEHWTLAGSVSGVMLFLYSTLFDSTVGGTVGKMVMRMKVVPISGDMSLSRAGLRNLTKVFPPLLLIDWIIGMAVDTKDPRQKWTDQVAHTSVIVYDHPSGT